MNYSTLKSTQVHWLLQICKNCTLQSSQGNIYEYTGVDDKNSIKNRSTERLQHKHSSNRVRPQEHRRSNTSTRLDSPQGEQASGGARRIGAGGSPDSREGEARSTYW